MAQELSDNSTTETDNRPVGPEAVREALVEATIDIIVNEGTRASVRQIATRARVNHGLVHTYFGSKDGLMSAALDEINRRAAAELRADGFPPPDLVSRRNGELAKAVARINLDDDREDRDRFSSHPILTSWQNALKRSRPDLSDDEVTLKVLTGAAVTLGWVLYEQFLCDVLGVESELREQAVDRIFSLTSELGGIPPEG